jgi:hypothetical protein
MGQGFFRRSSAGGELILGRRLSAYCGSVGRLLWCFPHRSPHVAHHAGVVQLREMLRGGVRGHRHGDLRRTGAVAATRQLVAPDLIPVLLSPDQQWRLA